MTDEAAFLTLADGTRVHRSVLDPEPDSAEALAEARRRAWEAADGLPPQPIDQFGNTIGGETASDRERIEASYWNRRLWSDPNKKSRVPPPQLGVSVDHRLVLSEADIAKEMTRLAPRGVFGQEANRMLRSTAVANVQNRMLAKEIAGGTVVGVETADEQRRKSQSCSLCGQGLVELMRLGNNDWACVPCYTALHEIMEEEEVDDGQ